MWAQPPTNPASTQPATDVLKSRSGRWKLMTDEKQAIALKFRLLSIRCTSEAFKATSYGHVRGIVPLCQT